MSDKTPPGEPETPLAFRAVRGGVWVAASSYFNIGFGFLANLALTRILDPEHFGVFALAAFFFSLLNLRPKIGIGQAFAQRKETTGELVGTHLVLDAAAGFGTLVVAAAAVPALRAVGYSWDVALVVLALAGAGLLESATATPWLLLDKELQLRQASLVSSAAFPLSYLPAFWLATQGGGYWSLVAQSATYPLLLGAMWWAARARLPHIWQLRWRFDRPVARDLVRFGGLVGLAAIAGMFVGQFDNFLVGTFVGLATLGFYDRAYRIAQWPSLLVTGVVTRAAFYTYARLQDDQHRLERTVAMTSWIVTVLAMPLALAIFASAPDVVALFYGERWLASTVFLRLLVVSSLLRPLLEIAHSVFVAVGKPQRATVASAVHAGTLISVGTPLTLAFGAVGTAASVAASSVAGVALSYWYMRRSVAISLRDSLAVPALAAVITMAAYLALVRTIDLNVLHLVVRLLLKAGFAGLLFLGIVVAIHPKRFVDRSGYVWRLLRGSQGAGIV